MSYVSLKQMAESKVDGIQKTTQFQCDPRLLEVDPGFNAREIDEDHVLSMADAILAGAVMPAIDVRVDAGRVIVVDGHHRRAAYLFLIDRGIDIHRVDCRQFRGNDVDRIAHMLTSAQGKPLTPLQMGIQYKKMMALNLTEKEIAARIGKSVQHVKDMVVLACANADVHAQVNSGKVSAKVAMKIVKKHGDDAGKVIAGHVATAESAGKKKVTEKVVDEKFEFVQVGYIGLGDDEKLSQAYLDDKLMNGIILKSGDAVYIKRKIVNNKEGV